MENYNKHNIINTIKIRKIKKSELNIVRKLLYNVYIIDQKWNFSKNNPAGLKIINNKLIDKRDEVAIIFGAFFNKKIIGCKVLL